jgi:hypothetical protein
MMELQEEGSVRHVGVKLNDEEMERIFGLRR